MPQASYPFAVARVSALSTKLLTSAQLRHIADATTEEEAWNLLIETGYGGAQAGAEPPLLKDIDYFIRSQQQFTRKEVWELTPDPERTKLFLVQVDVHNLKALLKARLLEIPVPDILRTGGIMPVELLIDAVKNHNYNQLPDAFKKVMNEVEQDLQREVDPLLFSAKIDGAAFTFINDTLNALNDHSFVRAYFSLYADFQNTRSLIRARFLHWDVDKIRYMLLDGGEMDKKIFLDAIGTPLDQLSGKLNRGSNGLLIAQTIDDYNSDIHRAILRKKMESATLDIIRNAANESFGLGKIIAYLFSRNTEARALRVIFGAKRSGTEPEIPEILNN